MRSALGTKMVLVSVVDERRELRVGLDDHIASAATVPAVGASLGNEGLAPEGHASRAAVAALNIDVGKIGKGVLHVVSFGQTQWYGNVSNASNKAFARVPRHARSSSDRVLQDGARLSRALIVA